VGRAVWSLVRGLRRKKEKAKRESRKAWLHDRSPRQERKEKTIDSPGHLKCKKREGGGAKICLLILADLFHQGRRRGRGKRTCETEGSTGRRTGGSMQRGRGKESLIVSYSRTRRGGKRKGLAQLREGQKGGSCERRANPFSREGHSEKRRCPVHILRRGGGISLILWEKRGEKLICLVLSVDGAGGGKKEKWAEYLSIIRIYPRARTEPGPRRKEENGVAKLGSFFYIKGNLRKREEEKVSYSPAEKRQKEKSSRPSHRL